MRTFLIALCVLANGVAVAQPVITSEITAGPYMTGRELLTVVNPPIAIAADGRSAAIAWSALGRIHIARLDPTGRIDGAIRVLPIWSKKAGVEAHHPSLSRTPSNDGFVVAWIETGLTRPVAAFVFLDAGLTPATAPLLLPANEVKTSIIVRAGATKVWIVADRDVLEVESDGTARVRFGPARFPLGGLALAGDDPVAISREGEGLSLCTCPGTGGVLSTCPLMCRLAYQRIDFRLYQPVAATSSVFQVFTHTEVALAADGDELLVAWLNKRGADGGDVMLSTLHTSQPASFQAAINAPITIGRFAWDIASARPDIAANGKRRVVVWRDRGRHDYDVVGASIDASGAVTRFDIATTKDDETNPSVYALPNGNFLVAYEKGLFGQRVVAWRYLLFEGRRRAVR